MSSLLVVNCSALLISALLIQTLLSTSALAITIQEAQESPEKAVQWLQENKITDELLQKLTSQIGQVGIRDGRGRNNLVFHTKVFVMYLAYNAKAFLSNPAKVINEIVNGDANLFASFILADGKWVLNEINFRANNFDTDERVPRQCDEVVSKFTRCSLEANPNGRGSSPPSEALCVATLIVSCYECLSHTQSKRSKSLH